MDGNFSHRISIKIIGKLSLSQTLFCGQAFRWIQDDERFFAVAMGQYVCVYLQGENLVIESDTPIDKKSWANYFALDTDYPALHEKFCQDEVLKKCVDFASGIRVLNQDFFETLITFIISQNNNIARITGIVERLCQQFGTPIGDSFTFPTAEKLASLTIEDLAPIRAGFRAKYIIDASQKVFEGVVTKEKLDKLSLEEASQLLQSIKGVGPKVSDCVLLFGLGRKEALPKDVWIKRAIAELFPNGLPPQCEGVEGIAQQYIFEYMRRRNP